MKWSCCQRHRHNCSSLSVESCHPVEWEKCVKVNHNMANDFKVVAVYEFVMSSYKNRILHVVPFVSQISRIHSMHYERVPQ